MAFQLFKPPVKRAQKPRKASKTRSRYFDLDKFIKELERAGIN